MTISPFNKTLSAACLVGGLIVTCTVTAVARSALEYTYPNNSGAGPLHAFVQLPIYLLLSALVALAVLAYARVKRFPAISARSNALLGALCGFASALQLATRWASELPALLVIVGITLGIAVFFRSRIGARVGA